jgi:hypothetical protein
LAARDFARRQALADVWLYGLLSVALPLFLLGATDWYFPARYLEFALLPLCLLALATAQGICQRWVRSRPPQAESLVALAVAMALVNPLAVAQSINAGERLPDHRGAARWLQAQPLQPNDIVVAEEVLYQWYYLGHVDYWLMGRIAAKNFAQRIDGQVVYQYTHTPLISSVAELQALIQRPDRGAVYIVGNAEVSADGLRYLRGTDIDDWLKSGAVPVVFTARDGATHVWRVPPPAEVR